MGTWVASKCHSSPTETAARLQDNFMITNNSCLICEYSVCSKDSDILEVGRLESVAVGQFPIWPMQTIVVF